MESVVKSCSFRTARASVRLRAYLRENLRLAGPEFKAFAKKQEMGSE